MSIRSIGETIHLLRKEKGITQEELGKAVGVSTQAVSKWECGGVPDTELLPMIADYFSVSIDRLFGRSAGDYGDIDAETAKYIASLDTGQRISKAFEHCWALERSLGGSHVLEEHNSLSAIRSEETSALYSRMIFDSGITLMRLDENLPYFLLMPKPSDGWNKALIEGVDYLSFFKTLSDEGFFSTLVLLYGRDNKLFTSKLLNKSLNISIEKAEEILGALEAYKLVTVSEIELDDEVQKVYQFDPNPALISLLAFAKELISKPNSFCWYSVNQELPYFQE